MAGRHGACGLHRLTWSGDERWRPPAPHATWTQQTPAAQRACSLQGLPRGSLVAPPLELSLLIERQTKPACRQGPRQRAGPAKRRRRLARLWMVGEGWWGGDSDSVQRSTAVQGQQQTCLVHQLRALAHRHWGRRRQLSASPLHPACAPPAAQVPSGASRRAGGRQSSQLPALPRHRAHGACRRGWQVANALNCSPTRNLVHGVSRRGSSGGGGEGSSGGGSSGRCWQVLPQGVARLASCAQSVAHDRPPCPFYSPPCLGRT